MIRINIVKAWLDHFPVYNARIRVKVISRVQHKNLYKPYRSQRVTVAYTIYSIYKVFIVIMRFLRAIHTPMLTSEYEVNGGGFAFLGEQTVRL